MKRTARLAAIAWLALVLAPASITLAQPEGSPPPPPANDDMPPPAPEASWAPPLPQEPPNPTPPATALPAPGAAAAQTAEAPAAVSPARAPPEMPPPDNPQAPTVSPQPGTPGQPSAELEIYGFAMLDLGYDFGEIGDPNWQDVLRPTKLPAFDDQFGRGGRWFEGVRQSRFVVASRVPTDSTRRRTSTSAPSSSLAVARTSRTGSA